MTTTEKAHKGPAMEGVIATWYARITKRDRGYVALADSIAAQLPPGARVLEVAPGPGYLAIELARRGLRVTTIDISHTFVALAIANARDAGVEVTVRQGNAAELPFADGAFDFVVCRAAFKNFTDPLGALNEVHRVLAVAGRASIIDLRKDATAGEIRAEVDGMEMSWLNAWWTRLTFRAFLLKNAYTNESLDELVARSRFGRSEIRRDGIAFDLRLAKLTPSA
jgi:ubiquinone/menaquinone biosynthesis C-methylase UbiE